MRVANGVDPFDNTWHWTHAVWFRVAAFLVTGAGAIWVGKAVRTGSFMFNGGFMFVGSVTAICAFVLPKTSLLIERDKKRLLRTTGPWIGFGRKTSSIPLESTRGVVFRWRFLRSGKRIMGSTHRLLLEDAAGKEHDLFPPNALCTSPQRCGKSLAEYLGVEFRIDGEE
jgi:hypothetical protein